MAIEKENGKHSSLAQPEESTHRGAEMGDVIGVGVPFPIKPMNKRIFPMGRARVAAIRSVNRGGCTTSMI